MKCKEECPIYGSMDELVHVSASESGSVSTVKRVKCLLDIGGECKALALAKFIKRSEGF